MFDPVLYPLSVSHFISTVRYSTDITPVGNQRDYRIARDDDGRVRFNAFQGVRSLKDLHAFISFFRRRKGRARAFAICDLLDNEQSFDGSFAPIGVATGDPDTEYQLSKTYEAADDDQVEVRKITKAQYGTVKIYVDAVEETHFTFTNGYQGKNHDTAANYLCTVDGKFKFDTGHVPAADAVIEAKFKFYVPVYFEDDEAPLDEIEDLMVPDPNDATKWILPSNACGNLPKVMMIESKET